MPFGRPKVSDGDDELMIFGLVDNNTNKEVELDTCIFNDETLVMNERYEEQMTPSRPQSSKTQDNWKVDFLKERNFRISQKENFTFLAYLQVLRERQLQS